MEKNFRQNRSYLRKFPFIDILEILEACKFKRTTQLFLISLVAYYYEVRRNRGKSIDFNVGEYTINYKVTLTEKNIQKKFKFSKDTIINIKRDLERKKFPISIETVRIATVGKKYHRIEHAIWAEKYLNFEDEYKFTIGREDKSVIYIPVKIIYDRNLTYSEKLALIWKISLKEKLSYQPTLKDIEDASGISERTVRKAKKKYPFMFSKSM